MRRENRRCGRGADAAVGGRRRRRLAGGWCDKSRNNPRVKRPRACPMRQENHRLGWGADAAAGGRRQWTRAWGPFDKSRNDARVKRPRACPMHQKNRRCGPVRTQPRAGGGDGRSPGVVRQIAQQPQAPGEPPVRTQPRAGGGDGRLPGGGQTNRATTPCTRRTAGAAGVRRSRGRAAATDARRRAFRQIAQQPHAPEEPPVRPGADVAAGGRRRTLAGGAFRQIAQQRHAPEEPPVRPGSGAAAGGRRRRTLAGGHFSTNRAAMPCIACHRATIRW